MIYKNSYFKKELRQAYIMNVTSARKKATFGFFLGLISIAVHFILQTLINSVLSDTVPYLMQPSYFSTVYTYINTALYIYVFYFIVYYDYLSFVEIRRNNWYLLVKMGYKPASMIFLKLIAWAYSLLFSYTLGFGVTVVMTVFLKYNFVYFYLPALYVVGLIDLIVVGIVLTTASLFLRQKSNIRYLALLCLVILVVLKITLGYNVVVTNRILMQDFFVIFDFSRSVYIPVCALITSLCLLICVLRANYMAKYYSLSNGIDQYTLVDNGKIFLRKNASGKLHQLNDIDKSMRRSKIFDALTKAALTCIVLTAVVLNVFIIMISTSQPTKEVTIRGIIPYVFSSNTMQPTIKENDLAYFNRVDKGVDIDIGEIVLFQENNVVYVERIIDKEENSFTVDIDYYPPMSQEGAMVKTIYRDQIYGVYHSRNRWLGALILFANSIFGRIAFLFVPVLFLYFYKPIKELFSKGSQQYF